MRVLAFSFTLLGAGLCVSPELAMGADRVLAIIDGRAAITEQDLKLAEREVGANPDLTPEERRRVLLEFLIQRQVLAGEAEKAKLQSGDAFERRLAYARRSVLQQLLIETRTREAVTDADAKKLYDEHISPLKPEDELHISQIVVADETQAKSLLDMVNGGADFATIAKGFSTDTKTAAEGGDLGWRIRSELPEKIAEAAFATGADKVATGPVQTDDGWHVVWVAERRVRDVPSFDDLKDDLKRALSKRIANEIAQRLRSAAKVVYKDPTLDPAAAAASSVAAAPAAEDSTGAASDAAAPAAPAKEDVAATTPPATPAPAPSEAPAPAPPEEPVSAPSATTVPALPEEPAEAPAEAPAAAPSAVAATAPAAKPAPAAGPEPFDMPATARATRWNYSGSVMKLLADGERVLVQYDVPAEGAADGMAVSGAPLFWGTRRLGVYSGQASVYTPSCGVHDYAVKGKAASDGNSFTVRGNKPTYNDKCEVTGEVEEVMVFEYAGAATR